MTTMRLGGCLVALAASAAGCGLIKVNGQPLGGGSSPPPSGPGPSSGGPQANTGGGSSTETRGAPQPPPPGQVAEWCKDSGMYVSKSDLSFEDFKSVELQKESTPRLYNKAADLAQVFCTTGRVADRDKILAHRAEWMRINDVDEGDFIVLVNLKHGRQWDSQDIKTGPTSQLAAMGYASSGFTEADQFGSRLSMIGKFHLAMRCSNERSNGLLFLILCTRDNLDVAKADAEIESVEELNLGSRFRLRQTVRATKAWHTEKVAEIQAKAKDDPGIAQLVAIADSTFKEWAAPSPKRAKLLALVDKMEAATIANKRSGFAGCEATTKAAWEEHLASVELPKVPSKGALTTFIEATLDTAEGYLAFHALRLCSAGSEENFYKGFEYLGSDVTRRGPRTATIANWLAAAGDIKFDNRSLKMQHLFSGLPKSEGSRWQDTRQGQIDKIAPFDGGVEITFKRVVEAREDCVQSVNTNRIASIDGNGNVYYRQKCVKYGMVKFDLTAGPIKIGQIMAAGLKPGMYLFAQEGLAIVATASSKSSKPIWVLGGSVK